jgi:hypothetical protein
MRSTPRSSLQCDLKTARSSAPSCAEELLSASRNSGSRSPGGGQATRNMGGGAQRVRSGDGFVHARLVRWRLSRQVAGWKRVHSRWVAAGWRPLSRQSCFARSSADNRSASQTGSWIGTVLEAQCRHHLRPLSTSLRPFPHSLYTAHCTLPATPLSQAFKVSSLNALRTTRRLSLSRVRLPLRRVQPHRGGTIAHDLIILTGSDKQRRTTPRIEGCQSNSR